MNYRFFRIGWILVIVTFIIVVRKSTLLEYVLPIAIYPVVTIFLLRKKDFPLRPIGLAVSWMGPLLMTTWMIALFYYFQPVIEKLTNIVHPPIDTIATMHNVMVGKFVAEGIVATMIVGWFIMGYGCIPILAFCATLLPHRFHNNRFSVEALAGKKPYKDRWMWAMLIFIFVLKMLPAAYFYKFSRDSMSELREIHQRIQEKRKLPLPRK